jgi:hypothetical protein
MYTKGFSQDWEWETRSEIMADTSLEIRIRSRRTLNIVCNKKQNAQDPLRNKGILKPLPGLHGPNPQKATDENIAILWYLPIS